MRNPETVVAMSFRRRVGTPAHSAATSSSRMAAKPRPIFDRSIQRAADTAKIASSSITKKRNST